MSRFNKDLRRTVQVRTAFYQALPMRFDLYSRAKGHEGVSKLSMAGDLAGKDAEMLEMTLSMLRCSICKNRFKNVALTRCYHLFCSECIDESIRNRNRKCPACGDKFGQDDVKSIYFTC